MTKCTFAASIQQIKESRFSVLFAMKEQALIIKWQFCFPLHCYQEIIISADKWNHILALRLCIAGLSRCLSGTSLTKPFGLGGTTEPLNRNCRTMQTSRRHMSLSQCILEFPLRCESSLRSSCSELGSRSYLAPCKSWFIASCWLESNLAFIEAEFMHVCFLEWGMMYLKALVSR